MIKSLRTLFKQDKESYKIPKSVQDYIPIQKMWDDGIFKVGNRYTKTFRFDDINYAVASREDGIDIYNEGLIKLLNESRYKSLKETFNELNIHMSEEQIKEYTKIIDYIAYVTEDKFTEMEMVAIYAVLGDIVEGKEPQMSLIVKSDDIIPTLVRIMEELPLTKGKLTMEQKLRIAFCERAITGVHEQPEGVVFDWYDTIEGAEKQFNFFRETMPSWFKVSEAPRINKAKYGLSVDEPIQTTSVRASYMYLNRLRYNGKPIIYERVGSCGGKNGNIVDRYRAFQEKGLLFKKKVFICDLYIDAYSTKQSNLAPRGFTL